MCRTVAVFEAIAKHPPKLTANDSTSAELIVLLIAGLHQSMGKGDKGLVETRETSIC